MNSHRGRFSDLTSLVFTALLFMTGFGLLAVNTLGVVPADRTERMWPVVIVAAGLVELLRWRDRERV